MRKRILLDECLPRDLKKSLEGHDATTVPEAGWASKDNGDLLALASTDYDVFVTVDRNLTFQQNIANLKIAVIVLVARGNRLVDFFAGGAVAITAPCRTSAPEWPCCEVSSCQPPR